MQWWTKEVGKKTIKSQQNVRFFREKSNNPKIKNLIKYAQFRDFVSHMGLNDGMQHILQTQITWPNITHSSKKTKTDMSTEFVNANI